MAEIAMAEMPRGTPSHQPSDSHHQARFEEFHDLPQARGEARKCGTEAFPPQLLSSAKPKR